MDTLIPDGMPRQAVIPSPFVANYRCYGLKLFSFKASIGWGFGSPSARTGAVQFPDSSDMGLSFLSWFDFSWVDLMNYAVFLSGMLHRKI